MIVGHAERILILKHFNLLLVIDDLNCGQIDDASFEWIAVIVINEYVGSTNYL